MQLQNILIICGSSDKTIKIWNLSTKILISTLKEHSDWVRSVIELKNGNIVSGADDNNIKPWNI